MKRKFFCSCLIGIVVFLLLSITSKEVKAQFSGISYPYNTHYFFHKYPLNPAYIGEEGEANIGLGYKKANGYYQTAGNRAFAYVHGKSEAMQGGGFGVLFNYMDANDRGIEHTQMSLGATATYNQSLMDLVDVKIGVTTSLLGYKNNRVPTSGQNPQSTLERFAKINLDAGLLFALADFELGFAMHHNNEPEFQFYTSDVNNFRREFYITAGYDWAINDEIGVEPHFILQSNTRDKDLLMQFTLMGKYEDTYFAGIGFITDVETNRNPLSNYLTKEFHKLRLTGAAKFAEQFLVAASVDFATSEQYKMQFETSVGYYFNRDDY